MSALILLIVLTHLQYYPDCFKIHPQFGHSIFIRVPQISPHDSFCLTNRMGVNPSKLLRKIFSENGISYQVPSGSSSSSDPSRFICSRSCANGGYCIVVDASVLGVSFVALDTNYKIRNSKLATSVCVVQNDHINQRFRDHQQRPLLMSMNRFCTSIDNSMQNQ